MPILKQLSIATGTIDLLPVLPALAITKAHIYDSLSTYQVFLWKMVWLQDEMLLS